MALVQPVCGPFPSVEGPALGRTVNWVVGAIGVAGTIVTVVISFGKVAEFLKTVLLTGLGPLGLVLAAIAGALVGFAIGIAIVFSKGLDRLQARPGRNRCYGGIVNAIARAFGSAGDYLLPYAAQHDRVDVVVKSAYWDFINLQPAKFAYCATDQRESALIRSYFYSNQVKSAVTGAMVGAVVGGAGAAVVGVFAGVGVAAAIGSAACAASLLFYLLCVALVIVVALIVALVLTLISATAAGAIGAATGGGSSPSVSGPPSTGGSTSSVPITIGNYVTFNAVLSIYGEDNDAWVGWWVNTTTAAPVLHGTSTSGEGPGSSTPFSFVNADSGFQDACPVA